MSRPTTLHVGEVLYWVIRTRDPDTMQLVDADSTPTVVVRKNGASTVDSVTVTKRAATTGIYDCSYDPAAEAEGDHFTIEETADVTGTTTASAEYQFSWSFTVVAVERGTDGANTTAPDNAGISAAAADAAAAKTAAESADGKLTSGRTSRLDRLPDVNAGAAGGLSLVGSEMTLDSATLAALFSDTDTAALVDAIIARVEDDLDGSDLSVAAIAVAVRDEVLNRLLLGNHDTDGSVGAFLQRLDAAVSSRLAAASYTAPDNAGISATAASAATAASQATIAATQSTTAATNTATLLTRVTAGAAQLWTDLIAMITGSGTADPQFTADALALAPAGGGGGSGSGARTVTVTVTDGTDPLQNAVVRMTEGVNTYTAPTNVSGVATFNLDDATYTVAISKPSYSYAGTTLAVDGDEAATYAMSAVVVPSPSDPALCAVTIPILNQYGVALADEVVEIRFNEFEAGATTTALVLSPPPTLTSDVDGLVEVTLLREAAYSVFYGQDDYQRRLDFTVPDAASYTVGE